MSEEIVIDGSRGEGGGQIFRSSLALALVTGRATRIENIRAGRSRPGLLRQHLTALRAAARIGSAMVEGDELGSKVVSFAPQTITHGDYTFSVGSAGSAMLVLHTVMWPLLCAPGRSSLVLEGGTHNPMAPPFEHLVASLFPLLRKMGVKIEAKLERAGFFPAGGGRMHVEIEGGTQWQRLDLLERGETLEVLARAMSANLSPKIARRELARVAKRMRPSPDHLIPESVESPGPGNAVMVELKFAEVHNIFTAFGERRRSAENVADKAVDEALEHLKTDAPVDEHLADQLLLPMALAGGGSLRASVISQHTRTNAEVIRRFVDVPIEIGEAEGLSGTMVTLGADA